MSIISLCVVNNKGQGRVVLHVPSTARHYCLKRIVKTWCCCLIFVIIFRRKCTTELIKHDIIHCFRAKWNFQKAKALRAFFSLINVYVVLREMFLCCSKGRLKSIRGHYAQAAAKPTTTAATSIHIQSRQKRVVGRPPPNHNNNNNNNVLGLDAL